MSAKLVGSKNPIMINILEMKDGQVGVIQPDFGADYAGRIVQRFGESLITLGRHSGNGWSILFRNREAGSVLTGSVRLLTKEDLVQFDNDSV